MFYLFIITKKDELSDYELLEQLDFPSLNGVEETIDELKVYYTDEVDIQLISAMLTEKDREFSISEVADENWNATWEENFDPVLINDFCYIKASFHPEKNGITHTLHITPKMSFGTGHHATTFQMIEMMNKMDFINKKVLDFGTGTGVLAILAEKMGAVDIVAIDIDEWSVKNADENIQINNCEKINIHQASISDINIENQYEVILANINRHILLENMEEIKKRLVSGGSLLLSGILEEDVPILTETINQNELKITDSSSKNNWVCLKCIKN